MRWIRKTLAQGKSRKQTAWPYRLRNPAELPVGGMPRTSGNEDGEAGTFHAPACPGNHGNIGGRKHPPPTVPLIRHDDLLAYTERKAPCHHTVRQGSRAEEAAVSGGGIDRDHGEGL